MNQISDAAAGTVRLSPTMLKRKLHTQKRGNRMSQKEAQGEMSLSEVIHNCRAMRRLEAREVPEELLLELIDAANQPPSDSSVSWESLK